MAFVLMRNVYVLMAGLVMYVMKVYTVHMYMYNMGIMV